MNRHRPTRSLVLTPEGLQGYLKEIYYDPNHPAGYGGASAVYNAIKAEGRYHVTLKQIKNWLRAQDAYTLFKPARKHFKRPRIIISDKDQQWESDTLSMTYYRKENDNVGYILVCIDVFTRFLITRPLVSLKGNEVKKAFEDIFRFNQPPKSIRTDRGSEFVNREVKEYFSQKNINHFLTNNETKACHAERVIRTIRTRIGRLFKGQHNFDWLHHLSQVTDAYNSSKHRALPTSPLEAMCVLDKNYLWHHQYMRNDRATETGPNDKYEFDLGDRVRISYLQSKFHRAYDEHFSKEIYTVIERRMSQGFQRYKIKSWNNSPVDGEFYRVQLQKVDVDENTKYEIERILKRRTVGPKNDRRREVLVKWIGWDDSYSSWVLESDVVDLQAD